MCFVASRYAPALGLHRFLGLALQVELHPPNSQVAAAVAGSPPLGLDDDFWGLVPCRVPS